MLDGRQFYEWNRQVTQDMLGLSPTTMLEIYPPWDFCSQEVKDNWERMACEHDLKKQADSDNVSALRKD